MNIDDSYSFETLNEEPKYGELCDMFLALAQDESTKEKLKSILYNGSYNGYCPSTDLGSDSQNIEIDRRLGLAYLIIRNPETFEELVKNNIVCFHGTNANALPSILKYGINSINKSNDSNIEVTTGETSSRGIYGRSFISFTDVLSLAQNYSLIRPSKETELSFPIVFGTTKENILKSNPISIPSDRQEIGVRDNFSKDKISCIMVPSSKVTTIKRIVGEDIPVFPLDDARDKFYGSLNGNIFIDFDEYERFKNKNYSKEEQLKGIKDTVLSRAMKNIKNKFIKKEGDTNGITK